MLIYFNKGCVYIKYRLQKQNKKIIAKEHLLLVQFIVFCSAVYMYFTFTKI